MSLKLDSSLKKYPYFKDLSEQINQCLHLIGSNEEMTLSYENRILKLNSQKTPNVYCDFLDPSFLKEVKQSYGRSEGVFSFLRSISKNQKLNICDFTVGMGRDFFKFILAGHKVKGFERNPVFYHLVLNGIERFQESHETSELKKLFKVDSFEIDLRFGSASCGEGDAYDLIYFDPMFDDSSKKAAPKKGMQALKALSLESKREEKLNLIEQGVSASHHFVYKCSKKPKDFSYKIKKEIKGKGFSYLIL